MGSSYSGFWANILQQSEYKFLAIVAIKKLVIVSATYLAGKGFSALVNIKIKKRNRLKYVDELMRGASEELILPRIKKKCSTISRRT